MQLEFSLEDNNLTLNSWKNITDKKLRKKIHNRFYRKLNIEKIKKQTKNYREANKDRIKKRDKAYYELNKDKKIKQGKLYREANKETIKQKKKIYYKANKETIKQKKMVYLKTNIQYKLGTRLRIRLCNALKGNYKSGSAVKDLGCSINELRKYLESKFEPGMSWDNYGFYGWHIDHIKPLSSFDLTDREQILKACHYTNLQPLWAKDNLSKANKY